MREKHSRLIYFLGAVLAHLVIFLLVATIVIWKAPIPPLVPFQAVKLSVPPPPPPMPPSSGSAALNPVQEPQPTVQPPATQISVITSVSSVFHITSANLLDQAMAHLADHLPQGSSLGGVGSGNSSGGGSAYGSNSGKMEGFVGHIYDLKQTPDGKPTNIAETPVEAASYEGDCAPNWGSSAPTQAGLQFLRTFVKRWDYHMLDDYYKAPVTLAATQICIPVDSSALAPKAYQVQGKIRARRWIAIYTASVMAPESGRYRFIGRGDDFLVVQIDQQNVLDGSLGGEELDPAANGRDDVGGNGFGYSCGSWVQMEARVPMAMSVLIGEGPGGSSGFMLLVQKEGDDSTKGDYPVFQLKPTPLPGNNGYIPPSRKTLQFEFSP